jgi:hypothetical protein
MRGAFGRSDDPMGVERVAFFSDAVLSTEAVHTPARVNVTCVTPLGEEVASTW